MACLFAARRRVAAGVMSQYSTIAVRAMKREMLFERSATESRGARPTGRDLWLLIFFYARRDTSR